MDFNSEFDPIGSSSGVRALKNPGVTFFHLLFRSLAVLIYLFGGYFYNSFIGIFVFVVLCLSLDFWTVKNITGRIMVGLRWWNYIDDEGKSKWVFEARNGNSQHLLSKSEKNIFWGTLILFPALWIIFFLTALLGFNFPWLVLVVIGIILTTSNLLGYLRCRMGSKQTLSESVSSLANSYMQKQMFSRVSSMFSSSNPQQSGGMNNVV